MDIKVLKGHRYGGIYRKIGTVYDCPTKMARLLVFAKKAEEYKAPPVKKAPVKRGPGRPRKTVETEKTTYSTKVMTAED